MGSRAVALIAGFMTVALLVAGCGGGEEEEALATATIAKPAYVKSVEEICEKAYETVQTQYDEFVGENGEEAFDDADSIEEYADTVLIPAREQQADEIRELGAPKGDEKQIEAILSAYDDGKAEAEEDPENAVKSSYGPWVPATELIKQYGAEDCAY